MTELIPTNLKKHAAAIHCSGELSLVERKLSNILLLNAYENLLIMDVHTIPTKHLLTMLGWGDSNNIEGLKATLKGLMSTIIEFNLMEDGGEIWQAMTLLNSVTLSDGVCRYSYAKDLAVKFYKPEIFAVINLSVQKQFKSNYALTLYENCVRFIRVGSTGWWDLATFRKIMGSTSETYDEFKRLSSFVIKKAVDEINLVSDIRLNVEYKKENRKVVALRFLITTSSQYALIESDHKGMHIDDIYSELKEKELYKRLINHGIGERLALSWIIEEPELAAKAVDYTEELDNKGKIKVNTAGYIRSLIESHAQFEESIYKVKKNEKLNEKKIEIAKQRDEKINKRLMDEYQKMKYQQELKILSIDELKQFKDDFLFSNEGQSILKPKFDSTTGKFMDKVTQITFLTWLKKKITPIFVKDDFDLWIKNKV